MHMLQMFFCLNVEQAPVLTLGIIYCRLLLVDTVNIVQTSAPLLG